MPPPSRGGSRDDYFNSNAEPYPADEVRLLDILTREDGEIKLETLHYRSGLTPDRFRFWLDELKKRGAVVTMLRDSDVYVALKGKAGS